MWSAWTRWVALVASLVALVVTGPGCRCGGAGLGEACDQSSDCKSGLLCDPVTGTCIGGGTDAAGTDAAKGTDAAGPDAANGTDGANGTDATPGTDGGTPGSDSGGSMTDGGTVLFCGGGAVCPPGTACQISFCGMGGEGFCAPTPVDTCGGFTPPPPDVCADPAETCLSESCIADAPGVCVTADERAAICAMQPTLWACP